MHNSEDSSSTLLGPKINLKKRLKRKVSSTWPSQQEGEIRPFILDIKSLESHVTLLSRDGAENPQCFLLLYPSDWNTSV